MARFSGLLALEESKKSELLGERDESVHALPEPHHTGREVILGKALKPAKDFAAPRAEASFSPGISPL